MSPDRQALLELAVDVAGRVHSLGDARDDTSLTLAQGREPDMQ